MKSQITTNAAAKGKPIVYPIMMGYYTYTVDKDPAQV